MSPNIDRNQIQKLVGMLEVQLVVNNKKDEMLQDQFGLFILRKTVGLLEV